MSLLLVIDGSTIHIRKHVHFHFFKNFTVRKQSESVESLKIVAARPRGSLLKSMACNAEIVSGKSASPEKQNGLFGIHSEELGKQIFSRRRNLKDDHLYLNYRKEFLLQRVKMSLKYFDYFHMDRCDFIQNYCLPDIWWQISRIQNFVENTSGKHTIKMTEQNSREY